MKKLLLMLVLAFSIIMGNSMANGTFAAEKKTKTIAAEFNFGPWIVGFGPSIDVDFNLGGTIGFLNGLNLHAGLVLHTKSAAIKALTKSVDYDMSGTGFNFGVRYFFGDTGMNGFYLGAKMVTGKMTFTGTGTTLGTLEAKYTGFAGELGARWILFDMMTLNTGISAGKMGVTATGTVTDGANTFSSSDAGTLPWVELIVAVGVAF